jgi:hypothetical protein
MLTHPTLDQLRALRLDGMADAFVELQSQDNARDLSHAEWLALLLDREAAKRDTSRFQTRLRSAKLRHSQASIEDVDYRAARRLDSRLLAPRFVQQEAAPLGCVRRLGWNTAPACVLSTVWGTASVRDLAVEVGAVPASPIRQVLTSRQASCAGRNSPRARRPVDLWTTRRGVAHKPTGPTTAADNLNLEISTVRTTPGSHSQDPHATSAAI